MAKLYPPYINGTIPAFYYSEGTAEIVVPFTMNKAVAIGEVAGFALKIKTINGDVKGVLQTNISNIDIISNASVTFFTDMTFLVGQYYKVQLAYIDTTGVIGYYSTVGVLKCTTKPIVQIEGLQFGQANTHNYSYTGTYSQLGGDVTEKMYSYQFVLYDSDNNIIADSGEQIHNTSLDDVPYESHEEFLINKDLEIHRAYYIQFIVVTTNKLVVHSSKYRIAQRRSVAADINADLVAGRNFNNGYILLSLVDKADPVISGTFLISRSSSKNNYQWEELKRFDLHSVPPETWSYNDYTVEQGITYRYSLQQYNSQGVYSERIISNSLTMDFEDMFLYDGERQLRIRYNPKVTTFKADVLETKIDTIGSQFPYISRNGNVNYKEFALSGLISYLSDENEKFISMKELGLDGYSDPLSPYGKYKTTNLVDYNIAAERIFKNEVLNWLNNGKVKLFKSPAEGNFLVRLMNVSLSPTDSLSRMLHTFSATAYEIADFSSDTLAQYGLIDPREMLETQMRWVTTDIPTIVQNYLNETGKTINEAIGDKIDLTSREVVSLDFRDLTPGAHVIINKEDIQIGATGAYIYKTSNNSYSISKVQYVIDNINEGQLTYGYLAQAVTVFELINDIQLLDTPVEQIIGKEYMTRLRKWDSENKVFVSSDNLFDALNDVRTTVLNVLFLKAEKRPIETLYMYDSFASSEERDIILNGENFNYNQYNYYKDIYCTPGEEFDWSTADPLALYRIRFRADTAPHNTKKNYKYYVDANLDEFSLLTNTCIDPNTKQIVQYNEDMFKLTINSTEIDLTEIEQYSLNDKDVNINYIKSNDGVIVNISYSKQIKVFNVESESDRYPELYNARNQYLSHVTDMINTRAIAHYDTSNLKLSYNVYLAELNKALDKYKEENGLVE